MGPKLQKWLERMVQSKYQSQKAVATVGDVEICTSHCNYSGDFCGCSEPNQIWQIFATDVTPDSLRLSVWASIMFLRNRWSFKVKHWNSPGRQANSLTYHRCNYPNWIRKKKGVFLIKLPIISTILSFWSSSDFNS